MTDAPETNTTTVTFRAGEVLFREDEPALNVFIINSGHVRLMRRVFRESVLIETLGRGNVCGDIAFAEGARYPVSAIASDDVEAVVVHRDAVEAVMLSNPKVVARLTSRMAARLTYAQFRVASFALRSDLGRVMLQLRHEAERNGALAGDVFAPIPFDLPEALAMERGRVDAALRGLSTEGIVELDGSGRFRLPSIEAFDRRLSYLELKDRFE